jgi:hypothetical protein
MGGSEADEHAPLIDSENLPAPTEGIVVTLFITLRLKQSSPRSDLTRTSALLGADSAHGEHDRSTAELEASRASQAPECCKHRSSSRGPGGGAAGCGQTRPRQARPGEPPGARSSSKPGLPRTRAGSTA